VPDEALDEELAKISPIYTPIRDRLSAAQLSYTDARGTLTALAGADAELRRRVAELREKYRSVASAERREVRLRWADLVSAARIESAADLEQVLAALRGRLQAQIDDDVTLVIE
jgi:hypothetical protein